MAHTCSHSYSVHQARGELKSRSLKQALATQQGHIPGIVVYVGGHGPTLLKATLKSQSLALSSDAEIILMG